MCDHGTDSSCYGQGVGVEATESWQAMIDALAGERPHRGRVLRLEAHGPGSRAAIIRYVHKTMEQHTTPKSDTSLEQLADAITMSVLNRLGAGYVLPRKVR
jgi:hypothetical protein